MARWRVVGWWRNNSRRRGSVSAGSLATARQVWRGVVGFWAQGMEWGGVAAVACVGVVGAMARSPAGRVPLMADARVAGGGTVRGGAGRLKWLVGVVGLLAVLLLASPRLAVARPVDAAAAAPAVASPGLTWKACPGKSAGPWAVGTLTQLPDPIPTKTLGLVLEDTMTVMAGQGSGTIAGGKVHVDVEFSGMRLYSSDFDLCDMADHCPVAEGDAVVLTSRQPLPPVMPPGDYVVTLSMASDRGASLACVAVSFHIGD